MPVGVYVDGYNLYYGDRGHCGRGEPGWRYLKALPASGSVDRIEYGRYVARVKYAPLARSRVRRPPSEPCRC